MKSETKEIKFIATPDKGEVSAILTVPEQAGQLLVLGHGASSNMRSPLVSTLAERLAGRGVATFRYNFPYSEKGGGRNSNATCVATVRSAVAAAHNAAPRLKLFAGGHSFSGRMTSTAASESPLAGVEGLVFFGFPLHPAGKAGTERAVHLRSVSVPMLFLSGTRDALAELDLLGPTVADLSDATLHLIDTADHSYKILKRSRKGEDDAFDEAARVAAGWMAEIAAATN